MVAWTREFTYCLMPTLTLKRGSVWIVWYQRELFHITLRHTASAPPSAAIIVIVIFH